MGLQGMGNVFAALLQFGIVDVMVANQHLKPNGDVTLSCQCTVFVIVLRAYIEHTDVEGQVNHQPCRHKAALHHLKVVNGLSSAGPLHLPMPGCQLGTYSPQHPVFHTLAHILTSQPSGTRPLQSVYPVLQLQQRK